MPEKQTTAPKQDTDDASKVVKAFERSWTYASTNYHGAWENAWKLYNNKRVKIGYEGVSNIFVPMTFSTIETMVAALASGKPSFDYLPPLENPDQDTKILNAKVDSYWDRDQWNIKVQNFVRSCLMYGTSAVYLYWDIDHPVMINVPIRDFFVNPDYSNMQDIDDGFYCGRRYLTTLAALKALEVVDPETGEITQRFKNLGELEGEATSATGQMTDKEQKDMLYGSLDRSNSRDQIEVIEYWTLDRCISVANRKVVIEDIENPHKQQSRARLVTKYMQEGQAANADVVDPEFQAQLLKDAEERADREAKGVIPFAVQRDYVDESLFYGRGEIEAAIADNQEWLNDVTNQNADYLSLILNPTSLLNPRSYEKRDQVQWVPGGVLPFTPDELQPYQMPQIPTEAFTERLNIKNEIREATAVSETTKGVSTDTDTTATEVNAQIAQAGMRIGMKATQLENEGFHRIGRIVQCLMRLYITRPELTRVQDEDGTRVEAYDPAEFDDDYELSVQLQTTVDAKQQKDMTEAKEVFAALMADPMVNKQELYKMVLPKAFGLDPDEVNKLLTPDPMAAMSAMPMDMAAAAPPGPAMPEGMPV